MAEDMKINPQRAKELAQNLATITSRINAASKSGQKVKRLKKTATPSSPQYLSNAPSSV